MSRIGFVKKLTQSSSRDNLEKLLVNQIDTLLGYDCSDLQQDVLFDVESLNRFSEPLCNLLLCHEIISNIRSRHGINLTARDSARLENHIRSTMAILKNLPDLAWSSHESFIFNPITSIILASCILDRDDLLVDFEPISLHPFQNEDLGVVKERILGLSNY